MRLLLFILLAFPSLSQAATPSLAEVKCGNLVMFRYDPAYPAAIKLAESASANGPIDAWVEKAAIHHDKREDAERDHAVATVLAKAKALPVSAESAITLNYVAYKYLTRSMCVQAGQIFRLVFPMLVQTVGWSSPETVAAINNRAVLLRSEKDLVALERFYVELAAATPPQRSLASVYTGLGELQVRRHDYIAAEKSLSTAVKLFEASPNDNMELRRALLDLSGALYGQMRHVEAESLQRRAHAIAPSRHTTHKSAEHVAAVMVRRGDTAGALAHVRAEIVRLRNSAAQLQIQIDVAKAAESEKGMPANAWSPSDPLRSRLRNLQGTMLGFMADEADLQHMQQDIAGADLKYGAADELAVALKSDLLPRIRRAHARVYRTQGKLTDAISILEKVLEGRLAWDGDAHPHTIDSRTELAEMYEQLGEFDFAVSHRDLLATAYQSSLRPGGEAQLDNLTRLVYAYRKLGRAEEAASTAEQIAALKRK